MKETPKQEAIRKAYGEHWAALEMWVNPDGWCRKRRGIGFEEVKKEIPLDYIGYEFRTASLQGIETNNGWIRIESAEDLPKIWDKIFFVIDTKFIGTGYFDGTNFWHENESYDASIVSHYQPINKPNPPIY